METVRHEETFTATEGDVMRDTDLRAIPGPGAIAFWLASDQLDSQCSIRIGGRSLAHNIIVPQRTNSAIQENNEAPTAMVTVMGGELIQVDVTVVTSVTAIRLVAVWAGVRRM